MRKFLYKQTDVAHYLTEVRDGPEGVEFPVLARATSIDGLMATVRLLVDLDDCLYTVESYAQGYPVIGPESSLKSEF